MKPALLHLFAPFKSAFSLPVLRQRSGQLLFAPFYHSVQAGGPLPHIKHLYPLRSLRQFEADIDYLLKYFEPVTLSDLAATDKFDRPVFFLSFDDGLREIYDHLAPVLIRKGVPATIFINSAFVDNKDLFFRYKASLLIEHLINEPPSAQLQAQIEQLVPAYTKPQDLLAISYLQRYLLDELAALVRVSFKDYLNQQQPYLSTLQIQELIRQGFQLGSHSVDHPLYNQLTMEEQVRQTSDCMQFIQRHFPQKVTSFAFPFTDDGVRSVFFKKVDTLGIADITFGCAGLKNDSVSTHIQRFPMEAGNFDTDTLVKAAYFYYIVKALIGKNQIIRQ